MSAITYQAHEEVSRPAMVGGQVFHVDRALKAARGQLTLDSDRHSDLIAALDSHPSVARVGEAADDYSYISRAVRVVQVKPALPLPTTAVHTYGLRPGLSLDTYSGGTAAYPLLQKMYDVYGALNANSWVGLARADGAISIWMLSDTDSIAADLQHAHAGNYRGSYLQGQAGLVPGYPDTSVRLTDPTVGGYILVPYTAALNPPQFTYECWIEPDSLDANVQALLSTQLGGRGLFWGISAGAMYAILERAYLSSNAEPGLAMPGDAMPGGDSLALAAALDVTASGISVGQLAHCAITFDGTNLKLYVNGLQVGSLATQDYAPQSSSSASMFWGSSWRPPAPPARNPYLGRMAGAAAYPSALSASQLAAHHSADVTIRLNVDLATNMHSDDDGKDVVLPQYPILTRVS